MYFPIIILLYAYLFFLLIFIIFSFFNIYHIYRFTFHTIGMYLIILFYLLASGAIVGVTAFFLMQTDWTQTFQLIPAFSGNF